VAPKRENIVKGGATFNNNLVASAPQSYLPYNNFANDPNYSVVAARNTGPFLTGVSSGGSRRRRKYKGGNLASYLSNTMNSYTSNTGLLPSPAINESSGVAGVMSGFSNTAASYDSTPSRLTPLA
jgi:hypothetical protein